MNRYPILLTLIAQSAVDVLDETLLLFDQALSARESAAKAKLTEVLAEPGCALPAQRRDTSGGVLGLSAHATLHTTACRNTVHHGRHLGRGEQPCGYRLDTTGPAPAPPGPAATDLPTGSRPR